MFKVNLVYVSFGKLSHGDALCEEEMSLFAKKVTNGLHMLQER